MLPAHKVLSLGVINGRNIWKTDLNALLDWLEPLHARLGERLWIAPSCSLLHVPVDLAQEGKLDAELKSWLAYALQKLDELRVLAHALDEGRRSVEAELAANRADIELNAGPASTLSTPHSPGLDSAVHQTNFKNCIHVLDRGLEELLLLHQRIQGVVERIFTTILGRHQRVRPNRSFIRRSLRPETKWRPSKEKIKAQKAQKPAHAPA